ncbi:MAG: Omp28-related outer membrane protein [Bacteroidia bacterium]
MKKQLLSLAAIGALSGSAFAQLPVSTAPQNKKAVLEEFTGVYCGYCPDGHQIATGLKNADPTNVVLINVHAGPYAAVAAGEPDFTTPEGTNINNMTNMLIAGYPAGDVNRNVFAGTSQTLTGMAQNRNTWTNTFSTTKSQSAYCNVALQGTVDVTTRVLTVQAQVYYTANSPAPSNSLTVVLLESKVTGPQHNYGTPTLYNASNYNPDGSYNHNHVLRKVISPNFGTTIPNTTTGTTFSQTYTYTIPATYGAAGKTTACLLGNLELAAFVTETNTLTINGNNGPITMINFPNATDVATTTLKTDASVCAGQNMASSFKFTNYGSTPVTSAVFSYAINGGAPTNYTYTGAAINPYTECLTINLPGQTFAPVASNTLAVNVISVNGVADQNPANDLITKTIPLTSIVANNLNMQMNFTQDQWGSEDSWKLYDEVTGTLISQDGPFTDLSAAGTVLHTKTFTVNPSTCYKLVVADAYGDGVNSGYGVGGYALISGSSNIYVSNGQYGTGETKLYKTGLATGIAAPAMNIAGVNLYPNPAVGSTNLAIELSQNETVNISVLNSLGQEIYTSKGNSYDAGVNTVSLNTENWAAGVYNVNISTAKGSMNQKLTVSK